MGAGGSIAFTLPTVLQKAENNPNRVAYYKTGIHGIPDRPGIVHKGEDSDDFVLIPDARENGWGDYLTPGADYCAKSNDLAVENIPGF